MNNMENKVKFKIIKEYPGSRSVNTEFITSFTSLIEFYRKYPEYFEEIKEELTFITYDGVKVKQGDYIYICMNFTYAYEGKITNINDFCEKYINDKNFLVFHSKEKLNDYIISNIPCLSINDIIEYFEKCKYFVTKTTKQELLNLAKNKTK